MYTEEQMNLLKTELHDYIRFWRYDEDTTKFFDFQLPEDED